MDSRLIPEAIFGFGVGDAEIIRNAGGRVTADVIRSLVVSQEILHTRDIFLIHHTDCGGQQAVRDHHRLIGLMSKYLGFILGTLLTIMSMLGLHKLIMRPITPTHEGLVNSVRKDVAVLKSCPLITRDVGIYGFIYDVQDGSLKEVLRREPVRTATSLEPHMP
ncbi:hypothetical protein WJX74_010765 [Apatococcus lobatus]|uniref:Carbonic anhydrase n=1 Tax=Apatococcus lobatus TaxID=904363 RepID=A0AAW1Q9K7_9CHLO